MTCTCAYHDQLIEIRRHLHTMPEEGWSEFTTTAFIVGKLREYGYEVLLGKKVINPDNCLGRNLKVVEAGLKLARENGVSEELLAEMDGLTGCVGVMDTGRPGPTLAIRFDIDCVPVTESTEDCHIPAREGFISKRPGLMHACGHDAHTSTGLAVAHWFADNVDQMNGKIKILFQPGEETLHGALEVLKSGAVDDVDIALGCHVRPIQDIPTGTCAAAVRHTSSTFADIVIHGRTAHASRPHLGVNCAEVAAAVTQAVAAIKGDPAKVWSCKVTSIQACAAAVNIIPDTATLKLDIRAQTNELMDELLEKVRMAAAGTAAAYGATAEVILPGVVIPAAVYDEDLVAELAGTIREVLGDECLARDCGGGGEDFHFFKKERPHIRAAYFGVGAGCTPGLHARNMTFDETQLDMGVRVLTAAALKHVG